MVHSLTALVMSENTFLYNASSKTPLWGQSKVQAECVCNLHEFLHVLILHMKREIACISFCLPCGIADNAVN